jgi:hypothetical protein
VLHILKCNVKGVALCVDLVAGWMGGCKEGEGAVVNERRKKAELQLK